MLPELKFNIWDSKYVITCGKCGTPLHAMAGTFPTHICMGKPRNLLRSK